jgi:hypothetical protein
MLIKFWVLLQEQKFLIGHYTPKIYSVPCTLSGEDNPGMGYFKYRSASLQDPLTEAIKTPILDR